MTKRTKIIATGVAALGLAGAGAGIAIAGSGDDTEAPIKGSDLEKASAAALAHTGEGTVSETEVGDEDSYYEVEVTLDDGSQVDVQLDRGFSVVGDEADSGDEDEGGADDA